MTQPAELPTNVRLIYGYTERSMDWARQSTARLNIRLCASLIVSGLFLASSVNVETTGQIDQCLVALAAFLASGSITSCALGLCVKRTSSGQVGTGNVITTEWLMKEWYRDKTDEECRCVIINTWAEAIADVDALAVSKSRSLKNSLVFLVLSGLSLCVSTLLGIHL
jgi:hypothetical protein